MPTISSSNDIFRNTAPVTYLAQDVESTGNTTFKVTNASDADNYKYIVFEDIPSESFEILDISSVSGDTITTNSTNNYLHNFNTPVYLFNYDQIEFAHSSEKYGTKTILNKKNIEGFHSYTYFYDNTNTQGFGHLRLYSSIDSQANTWSSPVPYGYTRKSARHLINLAKSHINEVDNATIDNTFGIHMINICEAEIAGMRRNWSWLRQDNYVVGQLNQGEWRVALPSNIYYTNSPGSIIDVNFGGIEKLDYIDIEEFKQLISPGKFTTLTQELNTGDTVIYGKNFHDFRDEGVVVIGENTIEYTGRTDTTLTGISGLTTSVSKDASITQNMRKGRPLYYTIFNSQIYVFPVVSPQYSGRNIVISYVKEPGAVTDLADETIIPDETIVLDYLVYHFDMKVNTQVTQIGSSFMQSYLTKIDRLKRQERTGVEVKMRMKGGKNKYKDKF